MIEINNGNLQELLMASDTGPFMQAEIVSLTGNGKLRVTCNWLYSSLNCDPNDNSTFLWQFSKVDEKHISLSPVNSCIGKPIYASVRDDIGYQLQVQAPYSADWITAVGRDEIISFTLHDLSIGQFNGFNGAYIALNSTADRHDDHTGYRVKSVGSSFNQNAQWFIVVRTTLQPNIKFSFPDNDKEAIIRQISSSTIAVDSNVVVAIAEQITTS